MKTSAEQNQECNYLKNTRRTSTFCAKALRRDVSEFPDEGSSASLETSKFSLYLGLQYTSIKQV